MLRRLKANEVADSLPPKSNHGGDTGHQIPLDADQVRLYDQVLADFQRREISAISAMHTLFQTCAAPSIFGRSIGPKLRWLCELVAEIRARGERVVIFAEWYKVQDTIVSTLSNVLDEPVDRINGTVESGLRLAKVRAFNQGTNGTAMVLGPKAAGVGLNVTGANHVVHFTRHWNPALESQATDRVYRIGQTKPVTVYRPVMTHPTLKSIEVHLDELLGAKEELANDVLFGIEELGVQAGLEQALNVTDRGASNGQG